MEAIRTKSVTVTFGNGAVRHFRVSVYKSEAYTYGNQFSLTLENEDNGYVEQYDIRYDTRIRRDLGQRAAFGIAVQVQPRRRLPRESRREGRRSARWSYQGHFVGCRREEGTLA